MKTHICRSAVAMALALGCTMATANDAAPPPFGTTLEALLQWSETHSPLISAMQADADARQQQRVMARALEDPMFGVEWRDINSDSPTLDPARVGSMKYSVTQALPLWGARDIKSRIAAADATVAALSARATRAEVREQIRLAWSERYRAQAAIAINTEIEQLLKQMEQAARQRYPLGQGGMSDIIRLHSELSMLQSEQLSLAGAERRACARLAALLDVSLTSLAETRVTLPPVPDDVYVTPWLDQARASNPELIAMRRSVGSAEDQSALAALNGRPAVKVGLSAIQMQSRLSMYELMLEVQIPLQSAVKQAQRTEAAAMLSRARAQQQSQLRQIEQDINELTVMLATARAQAELLDKTLQPQAELGLQATLAGYQNGKADFASLLEAQQQLRRLRQMRLQAKIEQFQAWTGLLKRTGEQ